MTIIDYYTKAIVATFHNTKKPNAQVNAWLDENSYLVHHVRSNRVYVIK